MLKCIKTRGRYIKAHQKRRYHLADDGACTFDSTNPDWLVGAD